MVPFISRQMFAVRVGSVVPEKDGGDQHRLPPMDRKKSGRATQCCESRPMNRRDFVVLSANTLAAPITAKAA
jgi:hypothetical protein